MTLKTGLKAVLEAVVEDIISYFKFRAASAGRADPADEAVICFETLSSPLKAARSWQVDGSVDCPKTVTVEPSNVVTQNSCHFAAAMQPLLAMSQE